MPARRRTPTSTATADAARRNHGPKRAIPRNRVRPQQATWGVAVVLALLTVLVYARVVAHEFVDYDDPQYVTHNGSVLQGLSGEGLRYAFTTRDFAMWHPLVTLSLQADAELYGRWPGGYHITNLTLHVANVLLLFGLLVRTTGRLWPAAFVGALFAVYPLHVESVAWISERKDVLSMLFGLSAVRAYTWYARRGGVRRYLTVAVLFAAALMSKTMLVTLPLVMLLLDYWPLGRLQIVGDPADDARIRPAGEYPTRTLRQLVWEKLPLLGLSAAASALAVVEQPIASLDSLSVVERLTGTLNGYATYLRKMVWPVDLACFYPRHPLEIPQVAVAAVLLIGGTLVALRFGRRHRYVAVGWFWYLGTLVPVIGLVQVGEQAYADRYVYLPLLGIYVAVAYSAAALVAQLPKARAPVVVAAIMCVAALAAAAWVQVGYWRTTITLFEHALDVTDGNYLAEYTLGTAHHKAGHLARAVESYQRVLAIKPDYVEAHLNLGDIYRQQGDFDLAEQHFQQALKAGPHRPLVHYRVGLFRYRQGDMVRAAEQFQEAIRLNPNYDKAHHNLAVVLQRQNQLAAAERHVLRALELQPNYAEAHSLLGMILLRRGDRAGGLHHLRLALAIDPSLSDVRSVIEQVQNQSR